jgi:nucleoside-diphosphate-sugar epimerase
MADKLIIGCGYLGRHIAALWCAQSHRVFATTRSAARADEWQASGLQPILCDVLDPASLRSLPRVESIAYCIGLDRSTGVSMHSVYVDGLANVLAALPQPPPRFLYVSSTSVYGQADGEEVDESATTEPQEESGKVVLEAERLLRARLPSAVILRFAGIYGPGRLMRGQAIKAGEPIVGDAEKWLNLIHVEDGAAVVVAADERAAPRSMYNVSDGAPVSRRVFYTKLAEVLRAPQPRFVQQPTGAIVRPHERGHRRIVSRRMREELGVKLQYLNYEAGLIASA